MKRACDTGLQFVPAVLGTVSGTTSVDHAGRKWDVTSWMSGQADFSARPSSTRLEAAATALARLHAVWGNIEPSKGRCPAIQRRLQATRDWLELLRSGWQPVLPPGDLDVVGPWAARAWSVLRACSYRLPEQLAGWMDRELPLQPCLCDIWHDHVLFSDDEVSGIIDYGGAKIDHVAVDLARMLGSMAGEDATLRESALQSYSRTRPLAAEEAELVQVLDRTGTVLGAANWLRWLYRDGRMFEDRNLVARRLAALVVRLERW
jgi:Ser/Thr protein kinase RdoA (MazF antagonist)